MSSTPVTKRTVRKNRVTGKSPRCKTQGTDGPKETEATKYIKFFSGCSLSFVYRRSEKVD